MRVRVRSCVLVCVNVCVCVCVCVLVWEQGWGDARVLAFILYLNDVAEGGETVFLTQGRAIKPARGRLAIFPTCHTHVHSGTAVQGRVAKYDVVNFVSE